MIETDYASVQDFAAEKRQRLLVLGVLALVTLIIVFGAIAAISYSAPNVPGIVLVAVGLAAFALLAVPVAIWKNPRVGLYLLLMGGILCGELFVTRPTFPTSYIPFWISIDSFANRYGVNLLKFGIFSIAEILMILTALCWLVRMVVGREPRIEPGPFLLPIGAYTLMVFIGWFHGNMTLGNLTMSLFEIRSQTYLLLAYLLAVNLFTTKRQLQTLLWVTVLSTALMAVFSVITYFSISGPVTEEGYMAHDNSLNLNLLIVMTLLGFILNLSWSLRLTALAFVPLGVLATLANQRRAGIAALILGLFPLLPMLYFVLKERRPQIIASAIALALATAIYLPVAWNGKGAWALPARAIKSQYSPSERDAGSDYYRLAETKNLMATLEDNPWFGVGYGKPFKQIYVLPQVSSDFLQYMPHNSPLWVWMRLGHVGFWLFWMMLAVVFIKGMHILKSLHDHWLKATGILSIIILLMGYTFGKFDLLLANQRQMFIIGLFLGVLGMLKKADVEPEPVSTSAFPTPTLER